MSTAASDGLEIGELKSRFSQHVPHVAVVGVIIEVGERFRSGFGGDGAESCSIRADCVLARWSKSELDVVNVMLGWSCSSYPDALVLDRGDNVVESMSWSSRFESLKSIANGLVSSVTGSLNCGGGFTSCVEMIHSWEGS